MTEQELERLENSVEQLIKACTRLKEENRLLREQQSSFTQERASLLDKNQSAKGRLEDMITRLKAMEQTTS